MGYSNWAIEREFIKGIVYKILAGSKETREETGKYSRTSNSTVLVPVLDMKGQE